MNIIKVIIPESINGLRPSREILLYPQEFILIRKLESFFGGKVRTGALRKPYPVPTEEDSIFDIEDWQFNEKLCKLKWEELSLFNSTVMLTNYVLLTVKEQIYFQPLLWKYILWCHEWNAVFSHVILSFFNDKYALSLTLKNLCSIIQKKIIIECLEMANKNLSTQAVKIKDELSLEEELEMIKKIIAWWKE